MILSAEFVIIPSCYKGHSARPEGLQNRALLIFMTCLDKCTTNAKDAHAKSITYGAKFELLCKSLQHDVLVSRHKSTMPPTRNQELQRPNSLKKHGKQDIGMQMEIGTGARSVAHKLHSSTGRRVPVCSVC